MTDLPILFSAPMIWALLAGRKTMTRRLMRLPKIGSLCVERGVPCKQDDDGVYRPVRPIWRVGDRLWVREAMRAVEDDETFARHIEYLADGTRSVALADESDNASDAFGAWWLIKAYRAADPDLVGGKTVPSIHMPRWASRLTLIVEDVKVERLRDISEEDAEAEGVRGSNASGPWGREGLIDDFADLWDSIHGNGAWDADPWVAALRFRVIHANIDALEAP